MALPTIVAQDEVLLTGQRCSDNARPAETMEDFLVEQAGWYLIEGYDSGWGVRVVAGTSGFDGMCRYAGYQYFVFVDGVFAGTVSPELMSSRSDGGAGAAWVRGREFLLVDFVRYAPTDAFCCPSGQSFAHYTIDLTDAGPMLRFTGATTQRVSTHSIRQTHAGATRG
ncbi:MAG: LppP/LprE family lipoprotein [Longimicrobiales bacterium]